MTRSDPLNVGAPGGLLWRETNVDTPPQSTHLAPTAAQDRCVPVRLSLRLLDIDLRPVQGAVVHIWHVAASGSYGGPTGDPAAYTTHVYQRSTAVSDADGCVLFHTTLPDPDTAPIHVTVTANDRTYLTTQLALQRDGTTNTPAGGAAEATTLRTAHLSDGAVLAWTTLVLRSPSPPGCAQ